MKVTVLVAALVAGLLFGGCQSATKPPESAPANQAQTPTPPAPVQAPAAPAVEKSAAQTPLLPQPGQEISLFDGQTLGQWKATDFGGQGEVSVKDGAIHMATGSYMTGITWTGPVVRMNYEITLEAMRVEGNDFFCGLTFPVGEKPCTLVLGGWGGSVCGLSSIDHFDASENETTRMISFENGKWYHVRLRVAAESDSGMAGRRRASSMWTRPTRPSTFGSKSRNRKPLGIATWNTAGRRPQHPTQEAAGSRRE